MEYYLFYSTEDATSKKDDRDVLLVKIDGGFYYYDYYNGKWVTDNLYDDYCGLFTEEWRAKSSRVIEISYDEAVKIINSYLSKNDEVYAQKIEDLEIYIKSAVPYLLSQMTYAYSGLNYLWDGVEDEENYITGAITYKLLKMKCFFSVAECKLPEEKRMGDETSQKMPTVPYKIPDEILNNNIIWSDGSLIYRGELIWENKGGCKLVIRRHFVRKSAYDGALRCYPDSVVGCWNIVFE